MFKKMCDSFSGLKMTVISGIFLLASLILMISGKEVTFDPAWVTVILSGYPLLYLAITRLVYKKWISSCLLISIAMIASLAIGELFAAGEVAFIMAIGAILEDMTVVRARKGLAAMIALSPSQGRILKKCGDKYEEEQIPVEKILKGDLLRVLPGETIPVDGKIITGETSVDQSIMTGESLPIDKCIGDDVFCGTMNCFGTIDIEATAVGEDSSLRKLISLVEQADEKKAHMQRIADQWSVWLVPIALLIAIGAVVVNSILGFEIMEALKRGVTVLVVFCPCALALATPTSIMAAIGQATKHGVIIKSGEALEAMGRVDTITFDKTGTLTYGKPEVSDVYSFNNAYTDEEFLILAASAEAKSEHPLAKALINHTSKLNLQLQEAKGFHMEAGRGVCAKVKGIQLRCGNEKYLKDMGVILDKAQLETIEGYKNQGKAIILVADDNECLGVIALSDVLRKETKDIIAKIKDMGVRPVLLTGDNQRAAEHFAKEAGVQELRSDLLPGQKVDTVEELQNNGRKVCMVGDGVNDAPALKTASVGVAMGSMGSDIAVDAADIALMSDDLTQLVYLNRLSKSTLKTIKGNITASMCINAVAVTLSVLGVLNPVTGALVHNAGSCLVVLNAALLYDRKFD